MRLSGHRQKDNAPTKGLGSEVSSASNSSVFCNFLSGYNHSIAGWHMPFQEYQDDVCIFRIRRFSIFRPRWKITMVVMLTRHCLDVWYMFVVPACVTKRL